jgi:hypothetical protein
MAVIGFNFKNGDGWLVANRAFDHFINDVKETFTLNDEDNYELTQALAFSCLSFETMKPDMRNRLSRILIKTASNIINDRTGKYARGLDASSYKMYQDGIKKLLGLLEKYEDFDWDDES